MTPEREFDPGAPTEEREGIQQETESPTVESALTEFDRNVLGIDYAHLTSWALPTAEHQIEMAVTAERAQQPHFEGQSMRDLRESYARIEAELADLKRIRRNQLNLISESQGNPDLYTAKSSLGVWERIVRSQQTLEDLRRTMREHPERAS